MSDYDKYKDIPDRRPEIYTVGMDGIDHPVGVPIVNVDGMPATAYERWMPKSSEPVTKTDVNGLPEMPLIQSATHEARVTSMMIIPRGKPIFHEGVTEVSITDEAAGEFVRIKQFRTDRTGAIEVDVSEWPVVSQVIEWMLEQCRLGNDG
jgi:hypothetical protein